MILTATGQPVRQEPQRRLTDAEAAMLRAYKKILQRYGYKEALWCQTCEDDGDSAGCRAYVTDSTIEILCRHRKLYFRGSSR